MTLVEFIQIIGSKLTVNYGAFRNGALFVL